MATIFFGSSGTDCIVGLDGDDYLSGRAGADLISAGAGADTAVGSDDYDNIFGQEGNDRLYAAHLGVQVPQFPDAASGRANSAQSWALLKQAMRPADC